MRKILIAVLLVLLIVLAYFTIFQGISIGSFKILDTKGIVELNNNLTAQINEVNQKIKGNLQDKRTELSDNVTTLLENKESYYNLANVSTENEITKASTEELYTREFLWLRVGRHARTEGVNIRMDILTGDAGDNITKNIAFTVTGQYAGIIEFVSALEDDSELAFRIEDFNMVSSGDNLQATFNVNGIRIKSENTTSSVESTTETGASETNNTDTTNTTDTTDTNTENVNEISEE